jgi:hypothetical protein
MPVMIPTHTSKAPTAAVERSFKSWFTRSDLFPKRAAQGITRATGQWANLLFTQVRRETVWKVAGRVGSRVCR